MMPVLAICQWIESTGPATWVREAYRGYPITETVHLLGMALFGGAVVMDDLCLLGWLRGHQSAELSNQLVPLKWCGFIVTTVSGVLLFMSDATMLYTNPAFLAKVILLLLIALSAWISRPSKRAAIISLLLWIAVIFASRLIGFTKAEGV